MATYPNKEYSGLPVIITSSVRINNNSKIIHSPDSFSDKKNSLLRYCFMGESIEDIYFGLLSDYNPICDKDHELEVSKGEFYITFFPEREKDLERKLTLI